MNLQPLYELRERLESSMIAGVSLIGDDFRLARAVEQMEPLAGVSPVFRLVYCFAKAALAPDCADKCGAVLDAYSLADAVLCTQGVVEAEGEIEEINLPKTSSFHSNAPYSVIAPFLRLLDSNGNGDRSKVVETRQNHPELFRDYRLQDIFIKGLGTAYGLADSMEIWLREEGDDVVPLLKRDLDPKGKKDMARRVKIMESIRGAKENSYYISLLDTAEKEVREAAIYALRHDVENVPLLLDLTKAEKVGCKKAAQAALSFMETPESLDYWKTAVKKKPGTVTQFLSFSKSEKISDILAEALETMTERMLSAAKEEKEVSKSDIDAFDALLQMLKGKSSPALCQWYRRAAQKPVSTYLDGLIATGHTPVRFFCPYDTRLYLNQNIRRQDVRKHWGMAWGMAFTRCLAEQLARFIFFSPDEPLLELARELFEDVGEDFFKPAFVSALLTQPAKEVYDKFSSYVTDPEREGSASCRLALVQVLQDMHFNDGEKNYILSVYFPDDLHKESHSVGRELKETLDHRWFEPFISGILGKETESILKCLVNPKDPFVCDVLGGYFYRQVMESSSVTHDMVQALKRCGWVGEKFGKFLVDAVKNNLFANTNAFWTLYSMIYTAPMTDYQKADTAEKIIGLVDSGQVKINAWHNLKMIQWCRELRKKDT